MYSIRYSLATISVACFYPTALLLTNRYAEKSVSVLNNVPGRTCTIYSSSPFVVLLHHSRRCDHKNLYIFPKVGFVTVVSERSQKLSVLLVRLELVPSVKEPDIIQQIPDTRYHKHIDYIVWSYLLNSLLRNKFFISQHHYYRRNE